MDNRNANLTWNFDIRDRGLGIPIPSKNVLSTATKHKVIGHEIVYTHAKRSSFSLFISLMRRTGKLSIFLGEC